jgi:hypothetical protein
MAAVEKNPMTRHIWMICTALALMNCTDALRLDLPDAGTPGPQRSANGPGRDSSTEASGIEGPDRPTGGTSKAPAEPEPPAATCDGVDCGPHSTCAIKSNGRQSCACTEGFERRGDVCVDIDECARGVARCAQECLNAEGGFECRCEAGLVLADDGENCRPLAWSETQQVPLQGDGNVPDFDIAVDAAGNTVLMYGQKGEGDIYHGWSTRYDVATKQWSAAEPVETLGEGFTANALAFDDEGNGLAIWSCHGVCANRYTAGTGWGEAARTGSTLPEGTYAYDFQLGMGDGSAVAVWIQRTEQPGNMIGADQVFGAHYTAADGWSEGEALAPSDGRVIIDLGLAVVPDGRAATVWSTYRFSGGVASAAQLRTHDFAPGRGWGTLRSYRGSSTFDEARDAALALGDDGMGLVACAEFGPVVNGSSSIGLTAHDYSPGDPLVMNGQPVASDDGPSQPGVSLGPSGDGVIVWAQSSAVYGRAYTRGGGFASTMMVGSGGGRPVHPRVAVNAHGNGIAVWQADTLPGPVWANTYRRDAGFGQARALSSSPGQPYPVLVIDNQGRATVAWRQTEGDISSIWFARFE